MAMLQRFFDLERLETAVSREIVAGLTTFLAMAYIAFVNPSILAAAGIDQGAAFVATCLAAAIGSLIMGLAANYPIALAPGMGLNAYFAYTVVKGLGYTWQVGLGAVFLSGCLFLPALVYIACLMARGLAELDWDDATDYAPAVLTALAMPLTFSIATGIGFGFVSYTAIKALSGRQRDLNAAVVVVSALVVLKWAVM